MFYFKEGSNDSKLNELERIRQMGCMIFMQIMKWCGSPLWNREKLKNILDLYLAYRPVDLENNEKISTRSTLLNYMPLSFKPQEGF